jgi:hypothetical protein
MVMDLSFYILGIYNMANGLEKIAEILKQLNDELKLDNDKWERAQNGSRNVLHTSNDGASATGGSDNGCCGKYKKQSN